MRYGFVLPYGDARTAAQVAVLAEEHGSDAFFVWEPVWGIDACVSLSAAAMRTDRIRLRDWTTRTTSSSRERLPAPATGTRCGAGRRPARPGGSRPTGKSHRRTSWRSAAPGCGRDHRTWSKGPPPPASPGTPPTSRGRDRKAPLPRLRRVLPRLRGGGTRRGPTRSLRAGDRAGAAGSRTPSAAEGCAGARSPSRTPSASFRDGSPSCPGDRCRAGPAVPT